MKICISEFTFNSFKDTFDEALSEDEILLLNREGKLSQGTGVPEVFLFLMRLCSKCSKTTFTIIISLD